MGQAQKRLVPKESIAPLELHLSKPLLQDMSKKKPDYGTKNLALQDTIARLVQLTPKLLKAIIPSKDLQQISRRFVRQASIARLVQSVRRWRPALQILGSQRRPTVLVQLNVAQRPGAKLESIAFRE